MMAGLENPDREQPRIDKVTIIHAGEDINEVIRPLASTLEQGLKLCEQAAYVRAFKPGTDIAQHVLDSICGEPPDETMRFVLVISDTFITVCSRNPAAFEQIKRKLFSRDIRGSNFAMVCPSSAPSQWPNLRCINMGSYVAKIEGGNLAEAVYKHWFGPQATLSSQAEMGLQDLSLNSSREEYAPDKVKIIHAMTSPDDRHKYWSKVADAVEDVAKPENTTQARILFKPGCSIAQTVLADLEGFQRCSAIKKVNAIFMWCPNMLQSLNQDKAAKAKVIEILCQDNEQQKLYAHFLFGIDIQQMCSFSQQLWSFLSKHRHMAYMETAKLKAPNVDFKPVARIFLRIWAGTINMSKSPEESSDPTMNSLETSLEEITGASASTNLYASSLGQFQPQQKPSGDRLVMNGESMDHGNANLTQQKARALAASDPASQDRLVTASASWDPAFAAMASKSREFQSDGSSNPPGHWSLRGESIQQGEGTEPTAPAPVCQPAPGSSGHNRMATGSMGSVLVDSVSGTRSKLPDARGMPPPSVPAGSIPGLQPLASRGTVSLPGSLQGVMVADSQGNQTHHPVNNRAGVSAGQNRIAASGFVSHSINSTRSNPSTNQGLMSQDLVSVQTGDTVSVGGLSSGSVDQHTGPLDPHLSVQQNPVRFSSDAANLDQELDDQIRQLDILDSIGGPRSLPVSGTVSDMHQADTSLPSLTSHRSMPLMCDQPNTNTLGQLGAEGMNSIHNGESSSLHQPESDNPSPGSTLVCQLDQQVIRGLRLRLDPMKQAIADWRDLASYFKINNDYINFWKSKNSPTEELIDWLRVHNQSLTVDMFKSGLEKIVRKDVLKYLSEKGY